MPNRPRLFTPGFVLLWTMTFLTFFAAFQLFPTVPLRLRALGASLAESGRFMSVFTAGSALGALFTGPLGDRLGQRRMAIFCAAAFGAFLVSYGFLTQRWGFYILALPHGVVWSGLLTATLSSLGSVLPEDRRADGMAFYGLASPGGVIFGPMIGLGLYQRWGFLPITLLLGGAFFVLSALATSLPADSPRTERRPLFQLPHGPVLLPCAILFVTALGYGALGSYTAQEALAMGFPRVLGFSTTSAFLTLMAVGMVLMRLVMTRVGFGARPIRLLPAMMWGQAIGLAFLAVLPGGLLRHTLSALFYGAGYSMVHTLVNSHVLEVIPSQRRGAAFGATLFSFDAGIGLSNLLLGLLIGHFGFRIGWGGASLAAFAGLPLAYVMAGYREKVSAA